MFNIFNIEHTIFYKVKRRVPFFIYLGFILYIIYIIFVCILTDSNISARSISLLSEYIHASKQTLIKSKVMNIN